MAVSRLWSPAPHQPLRKLESNLWVAEAPVPDAPYAQRMTLVRRRDTRVLVHNPICLNLAAMRDVDGWGPVTWLIVSCEAQLAHLAAWVERYPLAKVISTSALAVRTAAVARVDGQIDALPVDDDMKMERLQGCPGEGVLLVRSAGRWTAVFADAVTNIPHLAGLRWSVERLLGLSGGPRVSRMFRLRAVKDRQAFRKHLERLAETGNFARLVPCHGDMVEGDGAAAALRQAALSV